MKSFFFWDQNFFDDFEAFGGLDALRINWIIWVERWKKLFQSQLQKMHENYSKKFH